MKLRVQESTASIQKYRQSPEIFECATIQSKTLFEDGSHDVFKPIILLHGSMLNGQGQKKYSKTSNNGPSEKRTTSLQWTAHFPPIDFTTELYISNLREANTSQLRTMDTDQAPDVPWPIQNYLRKRTVKLYPHNPDGCRPLS